MQEDPGPNAEADKTQKCMVQSCKEKAATKLYNDPQVIGDVIKGCKEREEHGNFTYQTTLDYVKKVGEENISMFKYHSNCVKPIKNAKNLGIIRKNNPKRDRSQSPTPSTTNGRPSTKNVQKRQKRNPAPEPKAAVCMFGNITNPAGEPDWCPKPKHPNFNKLHKVESSDIGVGDTLIEIKKLTKDQRVKTALSDLHDSGDAFALEKHYHKYCLTKAERSISKSMHENTKEAQAVLKSLCDSELATTVLSVLYDDDRTLDMNHVNEMYLCILRKYDTPINPSENYKKYLKERLKQIAPNITFIQPQQKNKPAEVVLDSDVSIAVSKYANEDKVKQVQQVALTLRDSFLQNSKWTFRDKFDDYKHAPLPIYFLTMLCYGDTNLEFNLKRNEDAEKNIQTIYQLIAQSIRTKRQVKYKPKKKEFFRNMVQTPLMVGVTLVLHSELRSHNVAQNISQIYIGGDYQMILNLEKRIEQGLLQRMKDTKQVFCLPDFVKKDVDIVICIDNINFLEDTPTGQGTLNGTIATLNQRTLPGNPVYPPLKISEKLCSDGLMAIRINYKPEPCVRDVPIRFHSMDLFLPKSSSDSCEFLKVWALASHLAPYQSDIDDINRPNVETIDQVTSMDNDLVTAHESPILSVVDKAEKDKTQKKLKNEDLMPTWAATKSLLLQNSNNETIRVLHNTGVVPPLSRKSPTDYGTLYTILCLAQDMNVIVVGKDRKTVIVLDLDLYNRAIKLRESEKNTNWILMMGTIHICFAALHALAKTVENSGIDMCGIESGVYTAAALRSIFTGKNYKRGLEFHTVMALAILFLR